MSAARVTEYCSVTSWCYHLIPTSASPHLSPYPYKQWERIHLCQIVYLLLYKQSSRSSLWRNRKQNSWSSAVSQYPRYSPLLRVSIWKCISLHMSSNQTHTHTMCDIRKLHFLPKPISPVTSLQESTRERALTAANISFAKTYATLLASFVLLSYIVAWTTQAKVSDILEPTPSLHEEICDRVPDSPLCSEPKLFDSLESIASEHWVPARLLAGIYFAESRLWTHFSSEPCSSYNNWWGMKWKKTSAAPAVFYQENRRKPDPQGCWLYRFNSFEEATESLAKTLSLAYTSCLSPQLPNENQTKCISYAYVGSPQVAEQSWINRVSLFYPNDTV